MKLRQGRPDLVRQGSRSRASSSLAGLTVSSSLDVDVDVIDDDGSVDSIVDSKGSMAVINSSVVNVELSLSLSSEEPPPRPRNEPSQATITIKKTKSSEAQIIFLLFLVLPVVKVPDGALCIT